MGIFSTLSPFDQYVGKLISLFCMKHKNMHSTVVRSLCVINFQPYYLRPIAYLIIKHVISSLTVIKVHTNSQQISMIIVLIIRLGLTLNYNKNCLPTIALALQCDFAYQGQRACD